MGQIKSKKRVQNFGEVFTAEREVKAMCDLIPEETWNKIDSKFLEPTCGNGNFLVEILNRKLDRCKDNGEAILALSSIWGIDILRDNVEESKNRMVDIFVNRIGKEYEEVAKTILNARILCGDSLQMMKQMEENNEQIKLEGFK